MGESELVCLEDLDQVEPLGWRKGLEQILGGTLLSVFAPTLSPGLELQQLVAHPTFARRALERVDSECSLGWVSCHLMSSDIPVHSFGLPFGICPGLLGGH